MVRAALAGVAGRMGSRIAQIIAESEGLTLAGGFERADHPKVGRDLAEVIGGAPTGLRVEGSIRDVLEKADVVIDFTAASVSLAHLGEASSAKKPMVIGSTGFTPDQLEKARQMASSVPCVLAPNMSMGVNVLFKVVADVARLLGPDFDVEIVEAHHRFKKDSPSGSALSLAAAICKVTGRSFPDCLVHGREGKETLRTPGTIGMHAIRAGDITGEHSVIYSTLGETVRIEHSAHNRDNFVRGALRAALWLTGKPAGQYSMADCLGIA